MVKEGAEKERGRDKNRKRRSNSTGSSSSRSDLFLMCLIATHSFKFLLLYYSDYVLNSGLGPVPAPAAVLVPVPAPQVAPAPLQALVALAHPAHPDPPAHLAPQHPPAQADVVMTIVDVLAQSNLFIELL